MGLDEIFENGLGGICESCSKDRIIALFCSENIYLCRACYKERMKNV